jgi:hypothetical protein
MKSRWRAVALSSVVLGLIAATSADDAEADLRAACRSTGPNTVVCRVDEPTVNGQYNTSNREYREVQLRPGDKVTVNAGGCVQTGGHGRTWKRYVNPSGSNSDRLYHGLLSVPFGGIYEKPIGEYVRSGFTVAKNAGRPAGGGYVDATQMYLQLGYQDDEYGDNGYYSHDDGTEDQCRGVGNAFVELTITHDPSVAWPPLPVQSDGVKDGDETDVDCGGSVAKACTDGKSCHADKDCTSGTCAVDRCVPKLPCADVCTWSVDLEMCARGQPDDGFKHICSMADPGKGISGISAPAPSTVRLIKQDRAVSDANGHIGLTFQACRGATNPYSINASGYHLQGGEGGQACVSGWTVLARDVPAPQSKIAVVTPPPKSPPKGPPPPPRGRGNLR